MIGIALSGGGAKGDFEVGALLYLYEQGIRPDILCGTSVGAINAAKLAEGEGAGDQGLQGLEALWLSLERNADMYQPEAWLETIDPRLSGVLTGETDLDVLAPPEEPPENYLAWGDLAFLPAAYNFLEEKVTQLISLFDIGVPVLDALQKLMEAQAVYNLGPIEAKLATNLSPVRIAAWSQADSVTPKRLRLGIVGLESGRLRYVTESGTLLERDNRTAVKSNQAPPACRAIATTIEELRRQRDALLEQQAADIRDGYKPNPITRGELRMIDSQLDEQRQALADCLATTPPPPAITDVATGILASASIPGIFPPVAIAGETYVDGGVREVLPIQAALDLGAATVYGIAASPAEPLPAGPFGHSPALELVGHSLITIAISEIMLNETHPAAGWGERTVHIIQPTVDLHDTLTIDPGLISISIAYGYMRAADVLNGAEPTDRLWQTADEIVSTRRETWALECIRHGQPVPPERTAVLPADPSVQPEIDANRQRVRALVDERRRLGGALPAGADAWPVEAERHPWLGRTPRVRVEPPAIPFGTPTSVTVFASDAAGGSVAGLVSVNGRTVGSTNEAFTHTFEMGFKRVFDPEIRQWLRLPAPPVGKVTADGYDPVDVPFDFYDPATRVSDALCVGQSVPSTMVPGQRYDVSVRMRNTGTTTWTPGGSNPFRLGSQNPQDNSTWGGNRRELPGPVAPGEEVTFAFAVTAPGPGTYHFQWRMVQEGVEWFGGYSPDATVRVVAPTLEVGITPHPAPLFQSVRFTVRATNSATEASVAGDVLVNGSRVAATNSPFTYTFRPTTRRFRAMRRPIDGPIGGGDGYEIELPRVTVRAPGFAEATVDTGF